MGGNNREDSDMSFGREQSHSTECDASSEEFKSTWMLLKEIHERELQRLKSKLARLKKERLAHRRAAPKAREREFFEQQKVLRDIIVELRRQLSSRVCVRCSMNEAFSKKLRQDIAEIQETNRKCIAALTAEKDKLIEENKKLSEKLKLTQQQFPVPFSDSDDDFISCTQKTIPVFTLREPPEGATIQMPVRRRPRLHTTKIGSAHGQQQQQSPEFPIPSCSQELFEVPETSMEETSSNDNTATPGCSANQKASALGPQKKFRFQGRSKSPVAKPSQPQKKREKKSYTRKYETEHDSSWSFSSVSSEQVSTQVVSETSEENLLGCDTSSVSSSQSKEKHCSNVFHFDYTSKSNGKKRSSGIPNYNIESTSTAKLSSSPKSSNGEAALSTQEATYSGYGANKPQDDYQTMFPVSSIKRKAKTNLKRQRM